MKRNKLAAACAILATMFVISFITGCSKKSGSSTPEDPGSVIGTWYNETKRGDDITCKTTLQFNEEGILILSFEIPEEQESDELVLLYATEGNMLHYVYEDEAEDGRPILEYDYIEFKQTGDKLYFYEEGECIGEYSKKQSK